MKLWTVDVLEERASQKDESLRSLFERQHHRGHLADLTRNSRSADAIPTITSVDGSGTVVPTAVPSTMMALNVEDGAPLKVYPRNVANPDAGAFEGLVRSQSGPVAGYAA